MITLKQYDSLQNIANQACEHLPEGFQLTIVLEEGAATVELFDACADIQEELPDSADKTLSEQVNDAIYTAIRIHDHFTAQG